MSVELGHLYLRDLRQSSDDEAAMQVIERRVRSAVRWAGPVVERERDRGRVVSTCILVDNYFWEATHDGLRPTELARAMARCFESEGLPIDHIVYEAALAPSVHHMVDRLVSKPEPGAGTSVDPLVKDPGPPTWISNGEPQRPSLEDRSPRFSAWGKPAPGPPPKGPAAFGPGRQHSIRLDVELRDESERPWSCPTLAAWWQLVRLGALDVFEGSEVPPGTYSRPEAGPFAARRTLTVLAPEFLEVEHAVRVILSQVALSDDFRARMATSDRAAASHLSRMASIVAWELSYLFSDDGFDRA